MSQTQIEDERLLSAIREKYSAYIDSACRGSGFPASLLAALTANETGIDPTKSRFESNVFVDLAQVLAGKKANFGSIGAEDILHFISPEQPEVRDDVVLSLRDLMNLATSWGPTQIMGYHIFQFPTFKSTVDYLANLSSHYVIAVALLTQFKSEFHLSGDFTDETDDASAYFRCWNTGRPDGQTFDPHYAANGLRRMRIYESLPPRPGRGESEQQ